MANLFLVRVSNYGDDTSYSKVVVAPDDYTDKDIQCGIDSKYISGVDPEWEYIDNIQLVRPEWLAFIEDDFKGMEQTLRDLHIHPTNK